MTTQEGMDPAWLRARAYMGEGLTGAEYARRTGQSAQVISKWEHGSRMGRESVEEVAQQLGLSTDYLLFGEAHESRGPSRPAIVAQLMKIVGWIRGESVDWRPKGVEELTVVKAEKSGETTSGEDGGEGP